MMVYYTWKGYEISSFFKEYRHPMYVKSVRKGCVTWVTDYLYAAHYSEKTARKHYENIMSGVYENTEDVDTERNALADEIDRLNIRVSNLENEYARKYGEER